MSEPDPPAAFAVQPEVRGPWRRYLDSLAPLRPALHRYCCRLAGNVWDGEDLAQDTLLRVFGLLGKVDAELRDPRAYLLRTATHLWIDRARRRARERALLAIESGEPRERPLAQDAGAGTDVREAAGALLARLAPRERAAVVLKDVFDLPLEEVAGMLQTSVGAVKAALHRGRGRLAGAEHDTPPAAAPPPRELVERFVAALAGRDLEALRALCSADLSVELVGGAELEGFAASRPFFEHAHFVMPGLGFGADPHWRVELYDGEPIVLGFRTLDGVEGLNEVHRIEACDGAIARVRCYCFCPDTLAVVAERLGLRALARPYRSPGG
jgi:RNA polymerase sigma-70 factor (ECF subfamily)